MADLELITYCGLYCDLCSQRARIPAKAQALRESMAIEGYDSWGKDIPGFKDFWDFLGNLSDVSKACPGCRQGGGYPGCEIRKCAQKHNIEACPFCPDHPCERITDFSKIYPTMVSDGKRMKEIGIDNWITEQKARKETGFVYTDIRNPYPDGNKEDA